jgi:hypothetical protein
MKRLLRISFDLSLLSFIPIISWFLLGIIVDKNLINIFTLTYPLQFIYYIIKSIFSTGANISKEKDKNKDSVMSGLVLGIIVSVCIFIIILLNVDNYISFMNMDISTYKIFTIYSILQLFICLEFAMMQNKLYYEEKNKLANKYSLIFNLMNFILLIGTSLITKNQVIIITSTLIPLALFTLYVYIKNSNKFTFNINILNCIKYDSVELFNNIAFFIIFLFGLSNALEYGEVYATALTFIALITDTQWDTADAIVIASTIDISKNNFNYRKNRNNAYKLMGILFGTSLIMFGVLYGFYALNFKITMIYFSFEIVNFLIYPIYRIKTCYLQLEYSAFKTTTNKIVASILRFIISLLPTPFCTGLGQASTSLYQFITFNAMLNHNFKIDKTGKVKQKNVNQ